MQAPAAWRRTRGLPVASDLLDDRHHLSERLLGGRVHKPAIGFGPGGSHHVVEVARGSRPQLLRHEGHERMQYPEHGVEAEVRNVLGGGVAGSQAILRSFEIPIAELIPGKAVGRRHRVLEHEVLDPRRDG